MSVKKSKKSKIMLGFALCILGALFLYKGSKSVSLNSTFKDEPVEIVELSVYEHIAEDKLPSRVIIPQVVIDLEVERSRIINGYWEVFPDKAGWGEGSGIPGEIGNQVIFAHAKEGLFLPLRSIKVGDLIYVLTSNKWYAYEVFDIKEVYPNEVEVIAPSSDERLTLYTCSGFGDLKRLIVVAKKMKLPKLTLGVSSPSASSGVESLRSEISSLSSTSLRPWFSQGG